MRAVLLALLFLAAPAQAATVLSVGDGDTIRVDDNGRRLTIRMACIDAPEMAQRPYGQQSRAVLTSLAPVGSQVSLRVQTRDRYSRSVAEVFRGQQNLNVQMVRRGQAFAYRQYLRQCDAATYLGAERGPEIDRLGVWAERGGITRPWDFRQGRRSGATPAASAPRPSSSSTPRPNTAPPPGGRRYSCKQIGSYEHAQQLPRQGHTYLDGNGDGEACEGLRR